MDLSLTPEQEMLKNIARDFVARECPQTLVRELDEQGDGFSRDLWQKMAGLGWVGIIIPERYGGGGHSFTDLGVIYEEMGKGALPSPHHSSAVLCALLILNGGTDEQKDALLPAIARGERILALAATEPEYGWDPEDIQLRATGSASGYALNGTKLFVHDAGIADTLIVAARSGSSADIRGGITLFLVDRNAPGLSVRETSGWAGERQHEVRFENVTVQPDAMLGGWGGGWPLLTRAYLPATAALCAYMVGGLQEAYERTVTYSRTRQQFGVAVGTFQRVQDHVVNIVNYLDSARWTTYEALWKLDTEPETAEEAVSIAKAVTSEAFDEGTFAAHEVHAGIGISKEYGLHIYTKKARTFFNYLGDPAYHRNKIANMLAL